MNEEINYCNTGSIVDEKKPTHFDLRQIGGGSDLPESYETPYTMEIYHQHKIPACGAHAGAILKNFQEGRNHSPAYLWKRIKQSDGYPAEVGTSMEWIFKTLQKWGVCSLDKMPNNTTTTIDKYTDASKITTEMDTDAAKSKIGAYGFIWNPTFEQIKRAIYDFKAIIVRVEISADFWTPSWRGEDILPLGVNFPGQGGHFMVLNGYTKDTIKGINEWGVTWGDNGKFYFNKKYMGRVTYVGTCFDIIDKSTSIFTRTLKLRMKGTDVGVLQQFLKDKGFFPTNQSITKYFGSLTKKAVIDFQKSRGLTPDGIVGKDTIKVINES